jgi:tetratricopeptide (TPR) repeat protein
MAMATFYRGRIAFIRDDWANVVAVLDGFDSRFPDQTDYGPNALYMVMTTHLQQGDLGRARETFEHLHERFARNDVVGRAAFELYKVLKAELDKAAQAGEGGRTSELTREIVGYLKISNEVGGAPSYGNLRAESLLWIELGEWEEAETVLRRILQLFEGDRDLQKDLEAYILPDLGLCLLEQKRVPDAFEILAPLVPDPTDRSDARKPSAAVVTNWCRAVAGWVEGDASSVVEVPGVGGEENLDAACRYLIRLTNLAESWTCPWLELKFQTAYAYYRWGQLDSKRIETARGVLRDIRQFADAEYRLAAERCGNDVLQRRFQWLESKLQ